MLETRELWNMHGVKYDAQLNNEINDTIVDKYFVQFRTYRKDYCITFNFIYSLDDNNEMRLKVVAELQKEKQKNQVICTSDFNKYIDYNEHIDYSMACSRMVRGQFGDFVQSIIKQVSEYKIANKKTLSGFYIDTILMSVYDDMTSNKLRSKYIYLYKHNFDNCLSNDKYQVCLNSFNQVRKFMVKMQGLFDKNNYQQTYVYNNYMLIPNLLQHKNYNNKMLDGYEECRITVYDKLFSNGHKPYYDFTLYQLKNVFGTDITILNTIGDVNSASEDYVYGLVDGKHIFDFSNNCKQNGISYIKLTDNYNNVLFISFQKKNINERNKRHSTISLLHVENIIIYNGYSMCLSDRTMIQVLKQLIDNGQDIDTKLCKDICRTLVALHKGTNHLTQNDIDLFHNYIGNIDFLLQPYYANEYGDCITLRRIIENVSVRFVNVNSYRSSTAYNNNNPHMYGFYYTTEPIHLLSKLKSKCNEEDKEAFKQLQTNIVNNNFGTLDDYKVKHAIIETDDGYGIYSLERPYASQEPIVFIKHKKFGTIYLGNHKGAFKKDYYGIIAREVKKYVVTMAKLSNSSPDEVLENL